MAVAHAAYNFYVQCAWYTARRQSSGRELEKDPSRFPDWNELTPSQRVSIVRLAELCLEPHATSAAEVHYQYERTFWADMPEGFRLQLSLFYSAVTTAHANIQAAFAYDDPEYHSKNLILELATRPERD